MATYEFLDLAPAEPKYIQITINGDGILKIKKDYIKMDADGDYVNFRFHSFETNPYTNKLRFHYSDVSDPSSASASELIDNINDIIKTGGLSGTDGVDGTDGTDGREIELQTNATHIQWRYVGDVSWTNLVALSTITGPAGANGTNGADGQDGRVIYLEMHTDTSIGSTTAETQLHRFDIPGGTVADGDSIDIEVLWTFASTSASQKQFYVRIDQSTTMPSAAGSIVSNLQSNNSTGSTIPVKIRQDIKMKSSGGNTIEAAYINSGSGSSGVLAILRNLNIDLAADWYIFISATKVVTGDTITLKYANLIVNKKV